MEKVGGTLLKLNVATYWCHDMLEILAMYLLTPSKTEVPNPWAAEKYQAPEHLPSGQDETI